MKLRRIGLAVFAVIALSGVMVSSAFAAATTTDVQVYIGPSPGTVLSGSESFSVSGSSELVTTIGETPLTLKSTETECIGCTMKNEGGVAVTTGRLLFKNVTVVSPATCAVEGGKVETKLLQTHPDYMIGSTSYKKIEPDAPETILAQLKLIKGTGSCALAGTYNITGTLFLKMNNTTGVFAVTQGYTSNGSINTEAGGELKFGGKSAELKSANAAGALSGANKGKEFALK